MTITVGFADGDWKYFPYGPCAEYASYESDYGRLAGRLSYIYYTNGEMELAKKWGFVSSDAKSEYGLWTMGLIYFKEENETWKKTDRGMSTTSYEWLK